MNYLLLIYGNEQGMMAKSPEDMGKMMDAWFKYSDDLKEPGNLLGGEALQPTSTATTVRANNSGTATSDGPFAETKEQLGGFYVVDAEDLDDAIAWSAKLPPSAGWRHSGDTTYHGVRSLIHSGPVLPRRKHRPTGA